MKLEKALAIGTLSIPFLSLAVHCTSSNNFPNSGEERKKAWNEAISNVEVEKIPEFEIKILSNGDGLLSIPLGSYFICRGETVKPRHYVKLGDTARSLSELTHSNGEPFFTCDDIVKYIWYGGTLEYAEEMTSIVDKNGDNVFYGAQLPQFAALGLKVDEILNFRDTEKPNGLLVYPTYDINYKDQEGAFRAPEAVILFNLFREVYDVKVIVASQEDEICEAIDPARQYKLGIFSGHGGKYSLQLGKLCEQGAKNCSDDKSIIDTGDYELASCLDNFHKDAVFFLNSCSTAEGGDNMFNLANHVAQFAPGRKVIASKVPFSQFELKIDKANMYPFTAQIIVDGIDQTYVTKAKLGVITLGPTLISAEK